MINVTFVCRDIMRDVGEYWSKLKFKPLNECVEKYISYACKIQFYGCSFFKAQVWIDFLLICCYNYFSLLTSFFLITFLEDDIENRERCIFSNFLFTNNLEELIN